MNKTRKIISKNGQYYFDEFVNGTYDFIGFIKDRSENNIIRVYPHCAYFEKDNVPMNDETMDIIDRMRLEFVKWKANRKPLQKGEIVESRETGALVLVTEEQSHGMYFCGVIVKEDSEGHWERGEYYTKFYGDKFNRVSGDLAVVPD